MRVSLKPEILLGRKDPESDTFPEIDLTPYGAAEKGVSRRHAKIMSRGKDLILEDIGSVNGTFLNGNRVVPYQAETLESGDVIQLGMLVLQIFFELPKLLQENTQ